MNTTITEQDLDKRPAKAKKALEKAIFSPTAPQAKLKAKFWSRFQPGPFADSDNISLAVAQQVTKSAQLEKYWEQPGFIEWFANKDEERERLKYLFNKSLDTVENILDDPDANQNAKVNLIKMLAEITGHLSKKPVDKFVDAEFNNMSEAQLEAYLEQKGVKFNIEKVIDVAEPASSDEDK